MENYWQKIDKKPAKDLAWNLPEQKSQAVNIVGGNINAFNTTIKISEYMAANSHFKDIYTVLPDALQPKLPPLNNLVYLPSTASGSLQDSDKIAEVLNQANGNLLIGDFSKNTITAQDIISACEKSEKPTLITRDTVDLIATGNPEKLLMNQNIMIMGSAVQLQKLFRAVYYPKVILLTMSLMQIVEALHKFTLSYPVALVTLHDGQIIIAQNGKVTTVPAIQTEYSPITIWQGQLAGKILEYNLFNPNNLLEATAFALF